MFSLQVLGAVAQLERALISERTKAGIIAARSKGRLLGYPGIRERKPEALAKMTAIQKAAYGRRLQSTMNQWLPTVRRMRPDHNWDDIARVLKQRGLDWTPERLRRAVRWLVTERLAPRNANAEHESARVCISTRRLASSSLNAGVVASSNKPIEPKCLNISSTPPFADATMHDGGRVRNF